MWQIPSLIETPRSGVRCLCRPFYPYHTIHIPLPYPSLSLKACWLRAAGPQISICMNHIRKVEKGTRAQSRIRTFLRFCLGHQKKLQLGKALYLVGLCPYLSLHVRHQVSALGSYQGSTEGPYLKEHAIQYPRNIDLLNCHSHFKLNRF
jgi:hypothetical protein